MKAFFYKIKSETVENKFRSYILVWQLKDRWNSGSRHLLSCWWPVILCVLPAWEAYWQAASISLWETGCIFIQMKSAVSVGRADIPGYVWYLDWLCVISERDKVDSTCLTQTPGSNSGQLQCSVDSAPFLSFPCASLSGTEEIR